MNTHLNANVSVMVSGGLDSLIMHHYAEAHGFKSEPIYVNFKHPYQAKEVAVVRETFEQVTFVQSDWYGIAKEFMRDHIIWGRNAYLALVGALHNPTTWLGALDGEQNGREGDKSDEFFVSMSQVCDASFRGLHKEKVRVEAPFSRMSKAEIVRWALDAGLSPELLMSTVSCYHERERKCGRCLTCFKRKAAFLLNGIDEPGYLTNPFHNAYATAFTLRMENPRRTLIFGLQRVREFDQLKEMGVFA